jgi:dienelactone hydrolase
MGFVDPAPRPTRLIRSIEHEGVHIEARVMQVSEQLSIPAYLLSREPVTRCARAVMAIHGHGEAESCVGVRDDYHHAFALRLAQAGHVVLCPALRGFGALGDLALGDERYTLDYWKSTRGRQFTLISDAFLYGQTVIGQTIADLLRWEMWLGQQYGVQTVDVAGISYGGDLAITYPAFSDHVRKIYTSGSMGSFEGIFSRCYNAPAHGIPHILNWMDRSDIAGLNAPRPIRLHYGERDTPDPRNNSASYNETVEPALAELRAIYRAFGAESKVSLHVTPGAWHEMDNKDLRTFLAG